jgi:hypothetical protein
MIVYGLKAADLTQLLHLRHATIIQACGAAPSFRNSHIFF